MNTEDYAIVVGINDYRGLRPLSSAHADATRFYEWLTDRNGGALPEEHVELILAPERMPTDPIKGKPVKNDIDEVLRNFGVENEPPRRIGRRLYFYFAGHGVGPHPLEVAMLMGDAGMKALNANIGLLPYRLYLLNAGFFDQIVYILDCCRDPRPGIQGQIPRFNPVIKNPAPEVDDFVVLAASHGKKAFDPKDKTTGERRGNLTRALLEALEGEAEDAAGRVTTASLSAYIIPRVRALPVSAGRKKQRAVVAALPNPEFIFTMRPAPRTPRIIRIRIVAPKGLGGELVVSDADGMEVDRRQVDQVVASAAPWEVPLFVNRPYVIKHLPSHRVVIIETGKFRDGGIYHYAAHG